MNRGHFLELSIPANDVRESLDFWLRTGFTELPVNDVRSHFYAVVTDGRIALGLHGGGFDAPALSFVRPEVARHARDLEEAGHELTLVELGEEEFHEIGVLSPDGHELRFMEARTFSRQRYDDAPEPLTGRSVEISLRCLDCGPSLAFWQAAGFVCDDDAADHPGAEVITLRAPSVVLGLRDNYRWPEPGLRFAPADVETALAGLDRREIARRRAADGWLVTAPEGTRLLLVE